MSHHLSFLTIAASAVLGIAAHAQFPSNAGGGEEFNLGAEPGLFPDATEAFQKAFNSKARRVIIPNLGQPYVIADVSLNSDDQEIIMEQGVEIHAKPGAFRDKNATLLRASSRKNLTIRGNGAVLKMNKAEYQQPDHEKSEWRHGIMLKGCENILIENLTVRDSGGDGLYIGTNHLPAPAARSLPGSDKRGNPMHTVVCKDVVIRNVVSDGNHRQGLTIAGGENILVEGCLLENTAGTAPSAGVDVETHGWWEILRNITVRNCVARNNDGPGFMVYALPLTSKSGEVSVRFVDCRVDGGKGYGLAVGGIREEDGPKAGSIEFVRCRVENADGPGVHIYDKFSGAIPVRLRQCKWKNVASPLSAVIDNPEGVAVSAGTQEIRMAPLRIHSKRANVATHVGGVEFEDCQLEDSHDRPALIYTYSPKDSAPGSAINVKGTIRVASPAAELVDLGSSPQDISVEMIRANAAPAANPAATAPTPAPSAETGTPEPPLSLVANGDFEQTGPIRVEGSESVHTGPLMWAVVKNETSQSGGVVQILSTERGQVLDFVSFDPIVSQKLSTTPGKKYLLEFQAKGMAKPCLRVLWNGQEVARVADSPDWQKYAFEVEAQGDDEVGFQRCVLDGGPTIDDVTLVEIP